MSERVYNDRLLMKMRADAGDSPLNFDFSNTNGQTDDLLDFQQFVNKTSKDIKQMSFDTKYKDYTYEFGEEEAKRHQEEGTSVSSSHEGDTGNGKVADHKSQRKVVFSDHVTESDTDAIDAMSVARSKRSEKERESKGLDPCDIDLSFDEENVATAENTSDRGKGASKKKESRNSRKGPSSPDLLSLLQETSQDDDYSSDFDSDNDLEARVSGDEGNRGLSGTEDEFLSSAEKLKHRNKHCKHTLKQKTQEYYHKLPKLLKTSELRAKLPVKTQSRLENVGREVGHHCMARHRTAYDRALKLARFRSLPFSHSFLSRNISNMNTFSYFSGLPGSEKVLEKDGGDDENESMEIKKTVPTITASGREAIFGDIDMDDFYMEDDELFYFINPEELKNVVASSTSSDGSSRNEDQISSRSATTTYTSRTNTAKPYSGADSENER